MKKIKRADYIRSLSDEDLMMYIYRNSRYFTKGMKRLTEWLQEEIEVDISEQKSEKPPIPLEATPKSWVGRVNYNGHILVESENGEIVYEDVKKTMQEYGVRPCKACGLYPDHNGDDPCIAGLGHVINACCGHGNSEGYIQFDNGTIIRGRFTVEKAEIEVDR